MEKLVRFGVCMEEVLLKQFDRLLAERGSPSRSEAIRDLVREELVRQEWERPNAEVAGTLTLLYDHDVRQLTRKLTAIQHDHHSSVLSTMHIHLDEHNCLEVLVVRGQARQVLALAEQLRRTRGVRHATLSCTSTGRSLP